MGLAACLTKLKTKNLLKSPLKTSYFNTSAKGAYFTGIIKPDSRLLKKNRKTCEFNRSNGNY
jgi:hypothetical protein